MIDVIVVRGGHNGLTAAAYLARAGLVVHVLQRRPILGGACVTEEACGGPPRLSRLLRGVRGPRAEGRGPTGGCASTATSRPA